MEEIEVFSRQLLLLTWTNYSILEVKAVYYPILFLMVDWTILLKYRTGMRAR
jgi:hypothetical protein